jgi:hypothetical protein
MKRNAQPGNVLLYALLVIAAILSSAIVISNFVQSSVRQTTQINNYAKAYYTSESGNERLLYSVRKEGTIPAEGDCGLPAGSLDCSWENAKGPMNEIEVWLEKDQTFQFDLFDPDNNKSSLGVESIWLDWTNPTGRLEVTKVGWDVNQFVRWPEHPDSSVEKMIFSHTSGGAIDNSPVNYENYRVRIKPLYYRAGWLTIKLYDQDNAGGNLVGLPYYVNIKTRGSYNDVNAVLSTHTTRSNPALGLFDYVLFSEQSLVK